VYDNENFNIGQEPVTFAYSVGHRMGLGAKMGMIRVKSYKNYYPFLSYNINPYIVQGS